MSLIVAHHGTQHSYHAAVALKRAGLLKFYLTMFSLRRQPWLGPALSLLSPTAYRRAKQHHSHPELASADIRTASWHMLPAKLARSPWMETGRRFCEVAAKMAIRERVGLHMFDTQALDAFRALEPHGLPRILDQSIAHRRWSMREQQREAAAFPRWGAPPHAPEVELAAGDEEMRLADLILCGSEFCARTLVEEGVPAEKIAVVPYGADTTRFRPRDPRPTSGPLRMLFVGALSLRKGIHYLVQAAARLGPSCARLTTVGATEVSMRELSRYCDVLEMRGPALHEDMPAVYREADVYVFPSIVEGSSLSIYEAMASGLPVVTTPNAGSLVRDGVEGIIVPPRDVDALTVALERLRRDPDLRATMGRAARLRAEQLGDWRHYQERLGVTLSRLTPEARTH